MRWQIEPMTTWPYPGTKPRRASPFTAPWQATLDLLEREMGHFSLRGAVAVRVVGDPADVRRDGMLRATAKLKHPGVALSFTSATLGALTYPCDAFTDGWQQNLRAIALGLEALRKVERYGIASRGEQYAGWRAIEAGQATEFATASEARDWLATFTDLSMRDGPRMPLRAAARKAHPDAGGDPADWQRYESARRLLLRT